MPPKIIFIGYGSATKYKSNGITNFGINTLKILKDNNFNVSYFGLSKENTGSSEDHQYVKRVPSCILQFLKIVSFENKNTIYAFNGCMRPYLSLFMLILRLRKRKYVVFPHGNLNSKALFSLRKLHRLIYLVLIEKYFLKKASKVFIHTKHELPHSIFKKQNIAVLPAYIPSQTIKLNKDRNEQLNFLYLGRDDFYGKGIDRKLKFLRCLAKQTIINKVTFAGIVHSSTKQKILEELGNISITKLSVLGPVYEEARDDLFQEHNIFMLLSRSEGLPLSLMEAMLFGLYPIFSEETNFLNFAVELGIGSKVDVSRSSEIIHILDDILKKPKKHHTAGKADQYFSSDKWIQEFRKQLAILN